MACNATEDALIAAQSPTFDPSDSRCFEAKLAGPLLLSSLTSAPSTSAATGVGGAAKDKAEPAAGPELAKDGVDGPASVPATTTTIKISDGMTEAVVVS